MCGPPGLHRESCMMRSTDAKTKYIGAGIILMNPDNETFLVLKGTRTGVWSFSKGHPEIVDRETPLRTAVRETFEETGLYAGVDYDIIGNSMRFGKRPYWLGVMKHAGASLTLSRREHSEAAWLTWEIIQCLNANMDVRSWVIKSRSICSEFHHLISWIHRPS